MWSSPDGPVDVAIKTLKAESSEEEKIKFLQEAAIMGQFHHANIVTLHGVVTVAEPVSGMFISLIALYEILLIANDCVGAGEEW